MKQKIGSQIIFRVIVLFLMFWGDIVSEIRNYFPEIGEEWSERLLWLTIFWVFFGPILIYMLYSIYNNHIKTRMGQTMNTHMNVIDSMPQEWQNSALVNYKSEWSTATLGEQVIGYNATTVTGERVNPFTVDGK